MSTKYYEAGEHTSAYTRTHGWLPARTCGHKHKTEETAEKCAARRYPWTVYVVTDGRRKRASDGI